MSIMRHGRSHWVLPVLFSAFCLSARGASVAPELEFRQAGKLKVRLSRDDLRARLTAHPVRFASPFSEGRRKNYEAFRIQDVLQSAYGDSWKDEAYSDVAFIARDSGKTW